MPSQRRRRLAVISVVAGLAMSAVACSGDEAQSPGSTLGSGTTIATVDPTGTGALEYPAYDDASSPICVALSRRFALQLDSEPGAGYSWQVANTPDPAVVVPLGTEFRRVDPGVPDSAAVQYISFAASGLGTTTIEVRYVSPTGEIAANTVPIAFSVVVTFTGECPPPPPPDDTTTVPT